MITVLTHLATTCHQFPSPTVVMHHLGLFYYWHWFSVRQDAGRIICTKGRVS